MITKLRLQSKSHYGYNSHNISTKSSGHDGISNEILKCCLPVIEPILAKIFNEIIELSIYPVWMKIAKIVPLYKNGDRNLPENYRPISLISSLSNVFEKLQFGSDVFLLKA